MNTILSRIFLLLILVVAFNWTVLCQSSTRLNKQSDSIHLYYQARIDSLTRTFTELQRRQGEEYLQTLEKTNNQLSLWYNPYAVIVAVFVVLFTVLVIITAYIIYFVSNDYRDKMDSLVRHYRESLDIFITEKTAKLGEIDKEMNRLKEQTTVGEEANKKREDELKELATLKATVESQIATTVNAIPVSGSMFAITSLRHHRCSKCGWGFNVRDPLTTSGSLSGLPGGSLWSSAGLTVTCPKCGNVDKLQM